MTEENNTQEQTVNNEPKEMVPVGQVFPKFPTQAEWNTLNTIAQTLKAGGVLPKGIDTVQKMVVVLQAGREVGLQPIEALNSLYFVNGKVAMYGEAVPMQVMRAGHRIKWGQCDATTATVTITRGDTGESMTNTFTMAQAKERGYDSNPIYKKYPENMLKWRVLGMTAKFICPDALKGMGIKEEMETEVIEPTSPFHNKEESARVVTEVEAGTLSKRKSLDEMMDETDSEEDVQTLPLDTVIEKPKRRKKEDDQKNDIYKDLVKATVQKMQEFPDMKDEQILGYIEFMGVFVAKVREEILKDAKKALKK